ncbi:MAG: dual specificity protein phosphatase family protein [Opitutales bacterium]
MITWKHRLCALIGLSGFFLLVYGFANAWTAERESVGVVYFAWEGWIPFVSWMIIPYLSIDLFFVLAPFLIVDRRELHLFCARGGTVILAAGVCYLLFPLTLAVERPVPEGLLGMLWMIFIAMDQPHNLMPSLHIALGTIPAAVFLVHFRGWRRGLLVGWFILIGISTLTTYQHHFVDIYTGLLLGLLSLHLIRKTPQLWHPSINWVASGGYAAGGLFTGIVLVIGWPESFWLLWPLLAMGLASASSLGFLPASPIKRDGRLVPVSQLLWSPVLFGQWLSWLYYRRKSPPWNEVVPGVYLGRLLTAREAQELAGKGIHAVLDVAAEFSESPVLREKIYSQMEWRDLTAPTQSELRAAAYFIHKHRSRKVYVHCKAGYSRSAAAVGAYLLLHGAVASLKEVEIALHAARPGIVLRPEIRSAWQQLMVSREEVQAP